MKEITMIGDIMLLVTALALPGGQSPSVKSMGIITYEHCHRFQQEMASSDAYVGANHPDWKDRSQVICVDSKTGKVE
jgi:hypothetical protein